MLALRNLKTLRNIKFLPSQFKISGFNALRVSIDKSELPSARKVSLATIKQNRVSSTIATMMLMQFGQFVDHDLTQAPVHVKGWFTTMIHMLICYHNNTE